MSYRLKVNNAAAVYPISLAEVKTHLRLDAVSFADSIATEQTIEPKTHPITASYGIDGTGIDVLLYWALVNLTVGTVATGATLDAKIQESDDDSTYTDWTGGAFTQVDDTGSNTEQEIEYTGTQQYIKVVATVATDTVGFDATITLKQSVDYENDYLTSLIASVTKHVENILLRRALVTQTLEWYLDYFPGTSGSIALPDPPLQSVTSIVYTDTDDDDTTVSTDVYSVDTVSEPGRIVVNYGQQWPSTVTLATMNPIKITFKAGYGDAGTDVPEDIKAYMKALIATMYENRETEITGTIVASMKYADGLIKGYRVWGS